MRFRETDLPGVVVVEPEVIEDDRGLFARTYCAREFEEQAISFCPVQSSTSFNPRRGTVRGLHYQAPPLEEAKLVRCSMGRIYDVAVDIRPNSATLGGWIALELTASNRRALFVPPGFAHGFQTLVDDSEVLYLMSEFFDSEEQRGVRWDDPSVGIDWPIERVRVISERDRNLPLLSS
jgi:dTDP-4-dehydrorhamnose 3,5-epimerase